MQADGEKKDLLPSEEDTYLPEAEIVQKTDLPHEEAIAKKWSIESTNVRWSHYLPFGCYASKQTGDFASRPRDLFAIILLIFS